jgi:hypothetical protein
MEIVSYGGWERCARLVSGDLEMIVTLEVGPRIIRFGQIGGPNEFVEYSKDMGQTGGEEYRSYGGHRLWISPEEVPKTYAADNRPVAYDVENGWHVFTAPAEAWLVQKQVRIRPEAGGFKIEHRIYNRNLYSIELAPWVLTVMATGGECVFPQPPYAPQPSNLLPVRVMALWSYTNMADPRWTWGKQVVRLRQTSDPAPQKVGAEIRQGIAGYANHGNFFYKRFPCIAGATYPDFGCNFETFTRDDMLEVESVGPLQQVAPGHYASHAEEHYLLLGVTPPEDDDACGEFLNQLVGRVPLAT